MRSVFYMMLSMAAALLFFPSGAGLARAGVPPGFEIVQITDTPEFEWSPKMNNRGQIVFLREFGDYAEWDDLFLYDNGREFRITDDHGQMIRDGAPDINDDGTIVWSRAIGPEGHYGPTMEVMLYRDGVTTRLTDNDTDDWVGSINNKGQVAWDHYNGDGTCAPTADIWVWDGLEARRLTLDGEGSEGIANASAQINDSGDVVWTRYDFCASPWASTIQLYSNGQQTQISGAEERKPQVPCLNATGMAGWSFSDSQGGPNAIYRWKDGVRTLLTEWGSNPRLNSTGNTYFIRWHDDIDAWQAWYYMDGNFFHLSADRPYWNVDGDINEAGEAVWPSGDLNWMNIVCLRKKGHKSGPTLESPNGHVPSREHMRIRG